MSKILISINLKQRGGKKPKSSDIKYLFKRWGIWYLFVHVIQNFVPPVKWLHTLKKIHIIFFICTGPYIATQKLIYFVTGRWRIRTSGTAEEISGILRRRQPKYLTGSAPMSPTSGKAASSSNWMKGHSFFSINIYFIWRENFCYYF